MWLKHFGAPVEPQNGQNYMLNDRQIVTNWTDHDFRRSMATFLGDHDFNKDKIMTVLNHTDSSVTSIYNRSNYFKQKLEALNFWNEHLINKGIGGGRAYSV